MRITLFILFLCMSLVTSAQQLIELCAGQTKTVTYNSQSTGDGSNIWSINGNTYIGDEFIYTFISIAISVYLLYYFDKKKHNKLLK